MHLADTISRAYLPEFNACDFTRELEDIDHRTWLPVTEDRWQQLKNAAADDPVQQRLRTVIMYGWPESTTDVPECVRAYFDVRDSLIIQDELIFKGQRLVVPTMMRKELIEEIHSAHLGIEACIRRDTDVLYWPPLNIELKEYTAKCDVCLAHRSSQGKEPIIQHEFVARPWLKCVRISVTLITVHCYSSGIITIVTLKYSV